MYPTPKAGFNYDEEEILHQYVKFLDEHAVKIGVMLFEPQWGSSQAGMPWPKKLLRKYIQLAQSRGIKVICDEIMCGLGRHGQGSLFLSKAWELNPDAVTFGKAIGAGVFPLSGAIIKEGRSILKANKASVMQSHTYAGSSARALMAATEVLKEIPRWFLSIAKLGGEMSHIMNYINKVSDGMIQCHGQGLMWGGVFSREGKAKDLKYREKIVSTFRKQCDGLRIIPYYVPVGGFMVSPVIDIDVGSLYEMAERLVLAIIRTKEEVGWEKPKEEHNILSVCESIRIAKATRRWTGFEKCQPAFHVTKSCTSCSKFVCQEKRTRFINC